MNETQTKGFIKIDRNITKWRWFTNTNTFITFLTLLLLANYKDGDFENITIHRGQLAISHDSLSEITNLTISQVRTALNHLKQTGEITITRKPRYLLITIINYSKYQDIDNQIANGSQSNRNRITIKSQQSKKGKEREEGKERKEYGRSAPDSPSGDPPRGSAEWKAISHKRLKRDEGTADDIPDMYRDLFSDFALYHDWRNQ